MLLVGGQPK